MLFRLTKYNLRLLIIKDYNLEPMENKNIKLDSDFIFPKSSFWTGVASAINVAGNFYEFKYSKDPDKNAIKSDWEKVGKNIKKAQQELENKPKLCLK